MTTGLKRGGGFPLHPHVLTGLFPAEADNFLFDEELFYGRDILVTPDGVLVQGVGQFGFTGKERYDGDVPEEEFKDCVLCAGTVLSGLQIKRALHFFAENERAGKLAEALKAGDFVEYLRLVNESARSSEELLQNIVPQSDPSATQYRDCIELARKVLKGKGAVRVHGGGFAGTIQAYVPLDEKESFREKMEKVLGGGSCHYLSVSR